MAIYISGVKNLPEQVQKNKDDIENLDTNLNAKIDQAVAERKEIIDVSNNDVVIKSPSENVLLSLSDNSIVANEDTKINGSLEASGGIKGDGANITHNITAGGNITADGDITAIGNIYTDATIETGLDGEFSGYTYEVKNKVFFTSNAELETDGLSFEFKALDSSDNQHILKFDADTQKLTIDGNEVGGKPLYMHSYTFALSGQAIAYWGVLYSDSPTPFTAPTLADYLYNKGITSGGNSSPYKALKLTNSASDTIYTLSIFSADGTELKMAREGGASQLIATVNDLVQRIL